MAGVAQYARATRGGRPAGDARRLEGTSEDQTCRPARPAARRLNAKTAAAYVGPHSKADLTDARRTALTAIEITRDGIVRLCPNMGLMLGAADRGGSTKRGAARREPRPIHRRARARRLDGHPRPGMEHRHRHTGAGPDRRDPHPPFRRSGPAGSRDREPPQKPVPATTMGGAPPSGRNACPNGRRNDRGPAAWTSPARPRSFTKSRTRDCGWNRKRSAWIHDFRQRSKRQLARRWQGSRKKLGKREEMMQMGQLRARPRKERRTATELARTHRL